MQLFSNYNFSNISDSNIAFNELEKHIRILVDFINECNNHLSDDDYKALDINIQWLKRFYEAAERCVLNDK